MEEKEQDYAKTTFNEVSEKYDEIEFFKTSAKFIPEIIKNHTRMTDMQVLDVACGTGNVVIECATLYPDATFDAIDISEGMLAKAKKNAAAKNLDNIEFYLQDVTKLESEKKYNVITCGYVMFFLPDAISVLKSLVKRLRPNGIIIFTTFTDEAFSPSSEILLPLLEKYGSPTAKEYDAKKWQNLRTKIDIKRLCMLALVNDMNTHLEKIGYDMNIDEWWELVNNTGFKGMLMELSSENYALVKSEYYEAMSEHENTEGKVQLNADTYFVVVE